ncbi:SRPBCC domain-containing protein [Aeromicrobium sp.]|uniref:SRPBCC family protein n=1 Tax=Aeromicrobium sp. TaxID=1871063 RepID=UPI0030BDCD7C
MTDGIDEFTHRRVHSRDRGRVFACMTTATDLAHFWGPVGTHTPLANIVVDLRPGGRFETTMVNDEDGTEHRMRAVYIDIDPPSTLSWRDIDSGVLTTITFIDLGDDRTEVVTHQSGLPPRYRTPQARAGWQTSLDRFARYVSELPA